MGKLSFKVTSKRLTTQEGFLHLTQLILCILTIVGLHITGDLHDFCDDSNGSKNSYWSGGLWGTIVGLVGLKALCIIIASVFISLPRPILKWYYLIAAIVIFIVSCIGLGVNKYVDHYNDCKDGMAALPPPVIGEIRVRCEYGFLVNRFLIYVISIVHTMIYGVSFCIAFNKDASAKQDLAKPDNSDTTTTSGTTGTTGTTTIGDSAGPPNP